MGGSALNYAGASRPLPGQSANGDQWLAQPRPDGLRVAVIDGLGHGGEAQTAALAAIEALRAAPDLGPIEALQRCDQALRGTRGAAASVLVIDRSRAVLRFAGVGNVEGRLYSDDRERHFSPSRGILGRGMRAPALLDLPLIEPWTVLVHTDGIRTRGLELDTHLSARERAQQILATAARATDDATIVVIDSRG